MKLILNKEYRLVIIVLISVYYRYRFFYCYFKSTLIKKFFVKNLEL
ncbi:hypothetical protein Mp_Cg00200 (chloroplast) [Marchantia polymorpha subsp. ruderalis]|uniref:Uncharacterized protein n=3 Tax=Marchantia polymorpha TaxID=3197 RepID=A0A2Z6DT35_MARPO|nr:hypothetical protein MpKit2_Cp016 [Marchantia polymorpha subsp. ruderalis]YP_009646801.1 hypothetical protein [Marchantia polymorpha]AZU95234.1 hypothetical protein [Marchantia polymorpha]QBE89622.1 hypothetical protein [Marchantia polymorpha subsp. ruderalis]QHC83292.1 hypothetical protein [Marchantia polymorpha subsp. ruderalis]BBD75063.1 hypothetical protein MpKit2_Cp016 [Marchantia polymorpha subsp. ruderalis]BDD77246.1 hypothetical protein Mp_Cg00200 [Marchantia polymorpha subsp. rude